MNKFVKFLGYAIPVATFGLTLLGNKKASIEQKELIDNSVNAYTQQKIDAAVADSIKNMTNDSIKEAVNEYMAKAAEATVKAAKEVKKSK